MYKKGVFGSGLITDCHTMTYKGGVEVPGPMKRALKLFYKLQLHQ